MPNGLFLAEINREKGTLMDRDGMIYHVYEVREKLDEIIFFDSYFDAKLVSDSYGTGSVAYTDVQTRYAIPSEPAKTNTNKEEEA